jgi:hypothetical protein
MARDCKLFGVGIAIVALLSLAGVQRARAYDEQGSLDGALGYALLAREDAPTRHGAGVDLGASLGVSDSVMLRGTLGYALLADGSRHYLLDVLKLVPFFGLGATLTTAQHTRQDVPLRPGVHLVLGLDYLASRAYTVGLDIRSGILFESGHLLNATDVSLRLSRMFELF